MSEEQLKAFIAKVQGDTSLQEQLKAEGADVVAIAKAAGFTIKFYRRPKLSYLGRSISRWNELLKAYTLKALALAGAFYFFNDFNIHLKRHPIPGTIALQKVALMSYLAGNNQQ